MAHLAVLIANPCQEVRADDLSVGLAGLGRMADAGRIAQPVLDHEAVRAYQDRLRRLNAGGDAGGSDDSQDRADSTGAERDWLLA